MGQGIRKKITVLFGTVLLLSLVMILWSCCRQDEHLRIGLSKGSGSANYAFYYSWLKRAYPSVQIIDLYVMSRDSALAELEKCDALLLTGGADINPGRYGKILDTSRCEIEEPRDSLEFELINKAEKLKLPMLGVCRGLQILNVALGGSLVVDIPADFDTTIMHRCPNPDSCLHPVDIIGNTLLNRLCGTGRHSVNSNHHQGIGILSDSLKVSAYAPDGLPEAIEWKNPKGKSFLLAVQWHPERLDSANAMSLPISSEFIKQAINYRNIKSTGVK